MSNMRSQLRGGGVTYNYFIDYSWRHATHYKILFRGTQIWWIAPITIAGNWRVESHVEPRAFYAHTGD